MIVLVITASLGIGTLSAVCISAFQGAELHSLRKNEAGGRNPAFPWWMFLSAVHVVSVYAWAALLYYTGVIRLYEHFDAFGTGVSFFFAYWAIFELWYWIFHRLQHLIKPCGRLTGHNEALSEKYHHKIPPDYLTAFTAHPLDAFVVQLATQSPWIVFAIIGRIAGTSFEISVFTYGITITWLIYIGMRAHVCVSFGGSWHEIHHLTAGPPYSFSGIPEHVFYIASLLCKKNTVGQR